MLNAYVHIAMHGALALVGGLMGVQLALVWLPDLMEWIGGRLPSRARRRALAEQARQESRERVDALVAVLMHAGEQAYLSRELVAPADRPFVLGWTDWRKLYVG